MYIERHEGKSDLDQFDPIMAQMPAFSGLQGGSGLGFNWNLAIQIAGWTISGIGLGLSTVEAVRGAKEQSGVDKLEPAEISAIASQIAQADPQHRTAAQWEQILAGQFGQGLPPQPVPPGFYRDPQTGQLVPIPTQQAGFLEGMPSWAWIVIALLGYMLVKGKGIKI